MKKLFTLLLTVSLLADVFASSELFVRIRKNGNFIVSVNNQTIQNNSSIFRFFDLNTGYCTITVRENSWNNMIVFQQSVPIRNGYRYVAEISPRYGMRLIARYPFVQANWYLDNVNTNVQRPFYYGNPNYNNNNGWYNKTKNNSKDDQDDAGWYNNNWNSDDVYVDDNEDWNGSWNNGNGQNNNANSNSGWYNPNDNNSGWQNPNQQNQNQNGYGNGQYYGSYNYGNKTAMSEAELQTLLTTMKGVSFEEKMIPPPPPPGLMTPMKLMFPCTKICKLMVPLVSVGKLVRSNLPNDRLAVPPSHLGEPGPQVNMQRPLASARAQAGFPSAASAVPVIR